MRNSSNTDWKSTHGSCSPQLHAMWWPRSNSFDSMRLKITRNVKPFRSQVSKWASPRNPQGEGEGERGEVCLWATGSVVRSVITRVAEEVTLRPRGPCYSPSKSVGSTLWCPFHRWWKTYGAHPRCPRTLSDWGLLISALVQVQGTSYGKWK